ncbi:MAG TPA: family 16 glycosylhydrolase [Fibrobacteria bacterium]|nr:family 16 glycosylhydrolase [Fibrobacteria bacterium]
MTLIRFYPVLSGKFTVWMVLMLALSAAISSPCASPAGAWTFTWSDEFNGAAVDAAVWGFENGYVRNNEAQYYSNRSENSRIEDGKLLIRALKDNWSGHEYTSASRITRGKKSWRYGRFEIRAKIDIRSGSWPAWWWKGDNAGWPKGGEIDMMEYYQNKCLFNVMDGNKGWTSPTRSITSLGGPRWAEEYHTWTMEWDSTRIDLSLDGVLINHYEVDKANGTGPGGSNPLRQPGFMILNQALGGNQGGDHTKTAYPVDFRVDWIREHTWDPNAQAVQVTVQEGSGSGPYAQGTKASLAANMPPLGQVFARWEVVAGTAVIDDPGSPSALVTVPQAPVTVKATYRPQGSHVLFHNKPGLLIGEAFSQGMFFNVLGRRLTGTAPLAPQIRILPLETPVPSSP